MSTTSTPRNRRKIRAILASGIVLGVGAAITLAAWNDSVWGNAEFGTGDNQWNVQGNFTGAWDEYVTNPGGTMQFTLNAADLSPGSTAYALVGLREEFGNLGATIALQAPVVPGTGAPIVNTLADALTVAVGDVGTATGTCTAGNTGTTIASGPLLTTTATTSIAAGGERWLCFQVTLPTGTSPNGLANTVGVAWEFQATST